MNGARVFSNTVRKTIALGLCYACSVSYVWAQQQSIEPIKPTSPFFIRPYQPTVVPPIRLNNSTRLQNLVRAGKLYLTAQDAIALALENNLDVEIARYSPIDQQWLLQRYEAGGALPGVPSGKSQAGSVASGQGVSGSQAAAGVSSNGGASTSSNSTNATISQIGPVTPTLDPTFQDVTSFTHQTQPQFISTLSQTPVLIQNTRNYTATLQSGYLLGGTVTVTYKESYLSENAPTDFLNPSVSPTLSINIQQPLLQGFGTALNARTINIQRINLSTADLNFRTQVISVVSNVLNLYYGLVADYEDIRAKQSAYDVATKFYQDNQKQVEIGTLAPLDVTTAEAQVASTNQDLVVSQTTLQQQEVQLKNVLSRTGTADPILNSVQIIPLDRIIVPDKDDLPPLKDLVVKAMANRVDLEAQKRGVTTAEMSALGTANGVLPFALVLAGTSQQGLAGTPKTVNFQGHTFTADPYFVGGLDNALGQMFRRNFPSEHVGGYIAAPLRNRTAQADSAIDQLSLRQSQLGLQKAMNQAAVDVSNDIVALRQARVRYEAAVKNHSLEQQLLEAEQKKFALGASTPYAVIQQQRDLAAAQSTEVGALVTYSNARVGLEQTLGTVLEENHVSVEEAQTGKVIRTSVLPASLPQQP